MTSILNPFKHRNTVLKDGGATVMFFYYAVHDAVCCKATAGNKMKTDAEFCVGGNSR